MENLEPKRYEIRSIEDILNIVNNDNAVNLATDFSHWLMQYANIITKLKTEHPDLCKGKTNFEIVQGFFDWVDDGKNEILSTTLINRETGEENVIKHNQK